MEAEASLAITQAVYKHFKSTQGNYYCHFKGIADQRKDHPQRYVVRILGPRFKEPSSGVLKVELEVDCLCESPKESTDIFYIDRLKSHVLSTMTCINVPDVGVLEPESHQVGPTIDLSDAPFQRASVRCTYKMTIL